MVEQARVLFVEAEMGSQNVRKYYNLMLQWAHNLLPYQRTSKQKVESPRNIGKKKRISMLKNTHNCWKKVRC